MPRAGRSGEEAGGGSAETVEQTGAGGDRETAESADDSASPLSAHLLHRRVRTAPSGTIPILWREIRTWAYGRKVLIVRLTFLVLFALAAGNLWRLTNSHDGVSLARGALALLPMLLLSLVLVNAQAVTALTAERDMKALDLLLVSDLTPKEFVFGKLGGIFYNTKEIVLLPLLLCGYLGWQGRDRAWRTSIYLWIGMGVLYVFVAVVGLHAGLIYENSRTRDRHQPGHGLLPLRRRGHVHADHGGLQRLVQRPVRSRSWPSCSAAAWGCT